MKNTMRKFTKCFLLAACMLSVMACDKSGKNAPDFVDTRKWDEIVFDNVDRTSDFDEFTFKGPNGFSCTCVDEKNLMTREENSSTFGTSTQNRTYHYRLKSNSRYSYFKFTIPEDGFFRFAARTQNKEDETRTVVIEQNDNTLLTQIIKESDRVMLSADKACYPYYYVKVKAGTLILSYPVNPIAFYSFAFSANSNQSEGSNPSISSGNWYVRKDYKLAETEDFSEINEAIGNHTQISKSWVTLGNIYGEDIYATYDAFFDEDGYGPYFRDYSRDFGWVVFELNASYNADFINISGNRIKKYSCTLGNDVMGKKNGWPAIYSVYAGTYLGTLAYYGPLDYDLSFTDVNGHLITIDQQHIFAYEGDHLYEISNSGKEYIKINF